MVPKTRNKYSAIKISNGHIYILDYSLLRLNIEVTFKCIIKETIVIEDTVDVMEMEAIIIAGKSYALTNITYSRMLFL